MMRVLTTALLTCTGIVVGACGGTGSSPDTPSPSGDTTGSTVSVTIDEQAHYNSMAELIRGKVPGLDVIERGGEIELRIRGMMAPPTLTTTNPTDTTATGARRSARGGFTNVDPLLVIDGMIVTPGGNSRALKGLDPNQIESIVVHKDASSTVIWGSRGANGVIEIETKKRR